MYCVEVNANDMRPRGRSIRYSVMVALGMLRARLAGYCVDPRLDQFIDELLRFAHEPSLTPGDLGLLLWLDRRANADRAADLLSAITGDLERSGGLRAKEGMELAWIALGASEAVFSGVDSGAQRLLRDVSAHLCSHNLGTSGLLLHRAAGGRRRFPNFATQIYGTLA